MLRAIREYNVEPGASFSGFIVGHPHIIIMGVGAFRSAIPPSGSAKAHHPHTSWLHFSGADFCLHSRDVACSLRAPTASAARHQQFW